MSNEAGKGSKQRPTNHQEYAAAWDRIFGKKVSSEGTPAAVNAAVAMPMQSMLTAPTALPAIQAAGQPTQANQ